MPNPNAAPQRPGKVVIDLTPRQEKIEIDGFRIEQMVSAMSVTYDATARRPVLRLDLLPGTLEVTGTRVSLDGDFRALLLEQGWQPPR
jgi:hypothetical protein